MKLNIYNKFNNLKDRILNAIYPNTIRCIFCGDELTKNNRNFTCENCYNSLPLISASCDRCGLPMEDRFNGICPDCRRNNYFFNRAVSVFVYKDEVVNVVHKMKYNSVPDLADKLANFLVEAYARLDVNADIITFVPMHKEKQKARGYNQAELLAKFVAEKFKIPCLDLTYKIKDNPTQTALGFKERKENIKNVFEFNSVYKPDIKNKTILLIDDIFTTGATCNELTKIIKNAGAKDVFVLTLARSIVDI